jgi:2-keto-4-pentenoate hydratase/2-oxohepta-3-ene-1,7-dioic acid hydratase in catechol pathway
MRIVTFRTTSGEEESGLVTDDSVLGLDRDILSVCRDGIEGEPSGRRYRLSEVTLVAPVPRPSKMFCVGINYQDHAAEMKLRVPSVPVVFAKLASTIVGPGAPIVLPRGAHQVDYEAELAFVIGRGGRRIAANNAMAHVFGYTIINDITARDFHYLESTRWLMGKNFDTFAPMGPWITTVEEIVDPGSFVISLTIGGELLQQACTRDLLFSVPELIEYISHAATLEPGDIIATGTPAGVGFARKPPRFLKPNDEVVINVSGIGELRNVVVVED